LGDASAPYLLESRAVWSMQPHHPTENAETASSSLVKSWPMG